MRDEIQKFIDEFKVHGRKMNTYELTCRLMDNHPENISMLVEMTVQGKRIFVAMHLTASLYLYAMAAFVL